MGYSVALGEPIMVGAHQYKDLIDKVVVRCLDEYWDAYREDELKPMSDRDWKKFVREYDCVIVKRVGGKSFEVLPARRTRGGYMGRPEAAVGLEGFETERELGNAIQRAFERVGGSWGLGIR
jgi:hypothetical protein